MANLLLVAAGIEIGKAIAKQIFKLWVKDIPLAEDISSGLLDLIGSKTSDAFAKREGDRQFEKIGDKITKSILPLLKAEHINLDEGERNAIALEVASTLNKSRLTSDILLQQNLQPSQLEHYLLKINPNATRDFSAKGAALYERLIKEASVYIVDISSQLPSFTEHSFGEILEREDLILYKVDQVLNELHKMREALDPTNEMNRFEIDYRGAVTRNLDVLQLIGADVSLPNRRHKLSVAYITLSVAQKSCPSSLLLFRSA